MHARLHAVRVFVYSELVHVGVYVGKAAGRLGEWLACVCMKPQKCGG